MTTDASFNNGGDMLIDRLPSEFSVKGERENRSLFFSFKKKDKSVLFSVEATTDFLFRMNSPSDNRVLFSIDGKKASVSPNGTTSGPVEISRVSLLENNNKRSRYLIEGEIKASSPFELELDSSIFDYI